MTTLYMTSFLLSTFGAAIGATVLAQADPVTNTAISDVAKLGPVGLLGLACIMLWRERKEMTTLIANREREHRELMTAYKNEIKEIMDNYRELAEKQAKASAELADVLRTRKCLADKDEPENHRRK